MLDPQKRSQLEELNTDHHRRMTLICKDLEKRGDPPTSLDHDEKSRDTIIEAMFGCRHRCEMEPPEERAVLELGSGSGRDIEHLEKSFGATYYGVEVVEEAARNLKDRNVHHVAVEEMPEEWNGRFHYIYSRHVMEHVIDVGEALRALKRVLAPNGIIGAVTPHFFPDPEPAHVTKLRAEEWVQVYQKHGLRVAYCEALAMPYYPEAHLVAIHEEWPSF